jgi:adenine phosphoribosyltransferase
VEYYTINLHGLIRTLPLVHVGKRTKLANFTLLGDIELVDALADSFTERFGAYEFDYMVAVEVKVVPLVHGIAKRLGHKRFVVCRKRVKPYMVDPIIARPLATFPKHVQPQVINGLDAAFLKGQRVIVMDDVVSTGMTMRLTHILMEQIGASVVASAAVLRQGKQFIELPDFLSVSELPIIQDESHLMT